VGFWLVGGNVELKLGRQRRSSRLVHALWIRDCWYNRRATRVRGIKGASWEL
jgi:hypothetical protein